MLVRRRRRLWRDRSATTAVEFALIGPAFIAVLLMIFEFAFQLTVDLALNFGTTAAARSASTGTVKGTAGTNGANDTNNTTVAKAIVASSGNLLTVSRVVVSATSYGDTGSYAAGSGATAGSNGSSGSIVVYSVSYNQPFLTGLPCLMIKLVSFKAACPKSFAGITHQATVVVQNEPY